MFHALALLLHYLTFLSAPGRSGTLSGMDNTFLVRDPREYDFQMASWIAQEHSQGDTLLALHQSHPDIVPAPMTVKRWRREFPAFDLLMIEAEHARADVLVDQTLDIADSDDRTAGAARNSIQARQWQASRLNQARYGTKSTSDSTITHDGTVKHEQLSVYTDDDLQAIIRAGMRAGAIEGQVVNETATPGTPPGQENGGLEAKNGPDPSPPKISDPKLSVTTNAIEVGQADPLEDTPVDTPLASEQDTADDPRTDDKPEF